MNWPNEPTCHEYDPLAHPVTSYGWVNEGEQRTCAYCGSLHPEDLANALWDGADLAGADWKYGWPHKFYVNFHDERKLGTWYNIHFLDLDETAFTYLAAIISQKSGIEWHRTADGDVAYRAPRYGYQKFIVADVDTGLLDVGDDDEEFWT